MHVNLISVPTEAGTCHVHIRNILLGFLALISVCTLELDHIAGLSHPRHFSRLSTSLPLGACVTAGSIGRGLLGGKPLFWGTSGHKRHQVRIPGGSGADLGPGRTQNF